MITIVIKRKDGSLYWQDTFRTMPEAEAWFKEERTRKYWDESYTVEFIDRTQEIKAIEEQARLEFEARATLKKSTLVAALDLRGKKDRTVEESNQLLNLLVDLANM